MNTRLLIISGVLLAWLSFAQGCMKFRMSDAKAKAEFAKAGVPLHTATVNVNGFKLHYAQTGPDSFPSLLFVHGSPGSWDAFSAYLKDKDLLARYRMIAVDRPGFGFSQFGDAKNLADQATIINGFLKQVDNGKPICIIGHSLGGPLAVKMVAENPGMFNGMVLLAASVDPAEEPTEKWRGFLYKSSLQYLLPGAFRPSNTEIWYLKKDLIPLSKQFALIKCPVWILHGDKDNFVPVGNATYAKQMLGNAKSVDLHILKGASHFIVWEPWYKNVKAVLMQVEGNQN